MVLLLFGFEGAGWGVPDGLMGQRWDGRTRIGLDKRFGEKAQVGWWGPVGG